MKALRKLPKVDKIVAHEAFVGLSKTLITSIIREALQELREDILSERKSEVNEKEIIFNALNQYHQKIKLSLTPLINATGVVLHTNLGRAVLSEEIFEEAKKVSCGYCNLEFDEKSGKRGERYEHIAEQFRTLLGAEDVLVVNNNASAVFLVLNTFAKGKKAIVSRGELVEIGGSFRVPDVMRQSGCILKEVGTTNKTKLKDYKKAIDKKTALLMKVHKSNFAIKGFTQSVGFEQISHLAQKKGLVDYYDVGGAYVKGFGVKQKDLDLRKILEFNPSLVSFSGDKLFGSIQAGIIVGKKKYIDVLKQNQLLRMFRVDKVTLSLLEASIKAYLEDKLYKIPTLTLLKRSKEDLKVLCEEVMTPNCEIVETASYVGGGTMPDKAIESLALHVKGDAIKLQNEFRKNGVIGRIENDRFLLDFRSVLQKDLTSLKTVIKRLA